MGKGSSHKNLMKTAHRYLKNVGKEIGRSKEVKGLGRGVKDAVKDVTKHTAKEGKEKIVESSKDAAKKNISAAMTKGESEIRKKSDRSAQKIAK